MGSVPPDPLFPEQNERLLEQIETARAGLIALEASRHAPAARQAAVPWTIPGLVLSLLAGGAAIAASIRGRKRVRTTTPAASASAAIPRVKDPAADLRVPDPATPVPIAAGTPERADPTLHLPAPEPVAETRRPNPAISLSGATRAPEAVEGRLRTLEESLLEVIQAVEAVAARVAEARPEPSARDAESGKEPRGRAVAAGPESSTQDGETGKEQRGPAEDRDLSLPGPPEAAAKEDESRPPARTVDGRSLARIRQAVLRLSAEGWKQERIAERLRLGAGDVALILRTAGSEPRGRNAGSTAGAVRKSL